MTLISRIFLVGLGGLQPGWGQNAPASDSQLLQKLEAALKVKDKAAIMSLYNWEGVAPWVKADESENVDDWLTREFKSAKLSPLPTDFPSSGEHGNIRFHRNVEPAGIIEIGFTDAFGQAFPYGKKGGAYYIASLILEDIAGPHDETNSLVIRVQTPDGQPVFHTFVACGTESDIPRLHFRRLYGADLFTDHQGRLRLPLTETNRFLVAANARGFGWLPRGELANQAVMVLQPWARIEGVLKNRGHILANTRLKLDVDLDSYGFEVILPVLLDSEKPTTDANGRFVFEHVPPLKLRIDRQDHPKAGVYCHGLAVEPGETHHVEINLRGRTVTGRVVQEPGLEGDLDLTSCSAALRSDKQGPRGIAREAHFQVFTNGLLRADLVEPGDYTINGGLWREHRKLAYLDRLTVRVPDYASDADVPFDIGTVMLKAAANPKLGDQAPDFTAKDLDGRPLKLSDYRGKYVLLDFWATWCGPCVGETPNIKATYDAFGKDHRFVMISLSLDSDPAAPRKFSRDHDLAWTQGFLGDWSNDKITPTYGVYGIPAIFLIGPDGRVVATQLRGAKIKEAVAAALAP